jgi:replicative DNA helicase
MSDQRLVPRSELAENYVLGSMIRFPDCIPDVVCTLGETDFYLDRSQKMFRALVAMQEANQHVELPALHEVLAQRKELEDTGGQAFLAELWDNAGAGGNVAYYAKIVREKSIARQLIHASAEISAHAFDQAEPAEQLLNSAERSILEIGERFTNGENDKPWPQLLIEAQILAERRKRKEIKAGLPTGFVDVDDTLGGGLLAGELSIFAARPSVGKTSFACNIALHLALNHGAPVLFLSLEQKGIEIANRFICLHGKLDSKKLRTGTLSAAEMTSFAAAADELRTMPLHLIDRANLTPLRISAIVRRYHRKHGIQLVLVDYLQMVEAEDRRMQRYEQVDLITKRLKGIARELQIAVCACCQVNRAADEKDGRPRLRHLRESGGIEAHADMVLMLFPGEDGDRRLGFSVEKNRNGPTGDGLLIFEKSFMRFGNYAAGSFL